MDVSLHHGGKGMGSRGAYITITTQKAVGRWRDGGTGRNRRGAERNITGFLLLFFHESPVNMASDSHIQSRSPCVVKPPWLWGNTLTGALRHVLY